MKKSLPVPVDELNPYYERVENYTDLPPIMRSQIEHFFRHYKDLEKDKWVKDLRWAARDDAYDLIRKAISRYPAT
jgi:inorganic pyrophosphatase